MYGGTDLQGAPVDFISTLAYEILKSIPAVIITGGFKYSNERPHAISTDVAALRGAQQYAEEQDVDLKACYEAWIPGLDSRLDVGGAKRLSEEDGVMLKIMTGRTPLGRRLAMVAGVDVVITISGRKHTEVVVEQALELGVPVLPIPDAGGDSKDLLEKYHDRIAANFEPGALDRCLGTISHSIVDNAKTAAAAVVDLIRTAKVGKCLVLLPYDDDHDRLYASTVEPAIARHMLPVRLDRLPKSEAIYTSFAEAMQSSSAVIADITDLNKNVMYEIGYSHGRGLIPLIFTRDAGRLAALPVYFRTLNVRVAVDSTHVAALIEDYLRSLKTRPERMS